MNRFPLLELPDSQRWMSGGCRACLRRGRRLRKLNFFFLEADVGVTQSFELFFDGILIGCRIRGYRCRIIVDANVKGVLPREVARAEMVPTALISRSLVERCGQRAASVFSMPSRVGRP